MNPALQESSPPAPTAELMTAVAAELADLGRASAMLQELVAGKVRAGDLSGMALLDAQDADLLAQRLGELAKFLHTYASGLRNNVADPLTPALESILLGALVQRLSCNAEQPAAASGELEVF